MRRRTSFKRDLARRGLAGSAVALAGLATCLTAGSAAADGGCRTAPGIIATHHATLTALPRTDAACPPTAQAAARRVLLADLCMTYDPGSDPNALKAFFKPRSWSCGELSFDDVRWTSWTRRSAKGVGQASSEGNTWTATIKLSRARYCQKLGRRVFTRMVKRGGPWGAKGTVLDVRSACAT